MIRAFLVDDEPPARARLRQLLGEVSDLVVIGEADNIDDARHAIVENRPDVVFLDIEMPAGRGTTLAASLPEPRPFIVFATAFERYALDAFALAATDYLLKPITRGRLMGTLARVREKLSTETELEREVKAGAATQAHLIPRQLPAMPGFDAAAVTIPARGIGGDFYLAQALGDGRFGLALGDVSGKGIAAGLVASSVQARLEATARHAAADPVEVIADINRALAATTDAGRFATLVYLDIDPANAQITVVNAGHLPVIVCGADQTRLLTSSGPALGVLPHATFDSTTLLLAPDAMLVAYSDGLTEAVGENDEEFGERRLIQTVNQHRDLAAAHLCAMLAESVRTFRAGRPAADDLTVLVLKRLS
jgi:sigma-B regulation protein RsbU (phosphoserine phosphatase)